MVLSHAGRQQSWETAVGAQRAGALERFVTAQYNTGRGILSPELRARLPLGLERRAGPLLRRRHPARDSALVETIPWYDAAKQVARGPLADARLGIQSWANDMFDRTVAHRLQRYSGATLVHGFEASSLYTFRQARRLGLQTILDVPSANEWFFRAVSREAASAGLGIRASVSPWASYLRTERRLADWLFVGAEQIRRCLVEHGVPTSRIVTIPYGADPAIFQPPEDAGTDGVFRIVFAGHIGLRKGVRYLLEAHRRLHLPNSELILVGDADADGRQLLREYAGSYTRLTGVPQAALARLFRQSSVLAFPSLAEGSAFVVYEAMCVGLPVIVTPEVGSVARDGQDGIIVPGRDVDALAAALERLYRQPARARDMGRSGRERILSGYTWQHYQQRLGEAYFAIHRGEDVQAAVDALDARIDVPA